MKKQKKSQPKQIYLNRVKCDCVAQKHELVNNCLGCGKVVCAQQGEGPCLYCGKIVTRPDTTMIISSADQSLFPSLSKDQFTKVSQQRSTAILHKNKLVARDQSDNITQNIIDEQMDYYDLSENQWLDEGDRQNAIDRILQKDRFIEKEQFKTKVNFNVITGEFQKQEFSYDEDAFRQEGQKYFQEQQKAKFNERMRKTANIKNSHMDDRILKNDKMKEICEDIMKKDNMIPQKITAKMAQLQKKIKENDLLVEIDEEQTSNEPKLN